MLAIAALVSIALVLLIGAFLWHEAWAVLRGAGWQRFFENDGWHPAESHFGIMPMLWATLLMATGALALAGPLGLACALFIKFYSPEKLKKFFRRVIGLMAGIPSVVYGFWGLTVLVPLITKIAPPGASLLAGSLILAMMVLPTIALMCEAALASVPSGHLVGAAALGMTKKGTIIYVVLPAIKNGIIGAVLLATGRALGETMAVIMVAGNIVQIPTTIFDPVRVLTANIAMEMAYAVGDHRASLFVSGLILILLTGFLAVISLHIQKNKYHA